MRVAVVGAGLSGLAAARRLAGAGCEVVVFEKSRGVGGRLAARRAGGAVLDHGTPVVTAPAGSALAALIDEVAPGAALPVPWPPPSTPGGASPDAGTALVWPGGATVLAKAAAEGLDVARDVRVAALRPARRGMEVGDEQGNTHGVFEAAVITAPAPQAAAILSRSPEGAGRCEQLRGLAYAPAVMVLVGVRLPEAPHWFATRPTRGDLALVVHETAKGRDAADHVYPVVARLSADASAALIDASDDEALARALPALGDLLGPAAGDPAWAQVKRWRLAVPLGRLGAETVNPPGARIVVAGDTITGARLDGCHHSAVYDSGLWAADRLLRTLAPVA